MFRTCHPGWRPGGKSTASRVLRIIGFGIAGLFFAAGFAILFALVVQALWNWIMPAVFALPAITFWQAFGLLLLAKLLFGGFGHHRPRHPGPPRWPHHPLPAEGIEDANGACWPDARWNQYRRFWNEEGRDAFRAFVQRQQAGAGTPGGESPPEDAGPDRSSP